mmetsp:Transcript_28625/g.40353  ORF Transcript_28625/g.40353 Transcript_28625/m.40353 type:complete len:335 (+) Transcript_28625:40-1044(+)
MANTNLIAVLILGIQLTTIFGSPLCAQFTSTTLNSIQNDMTITCTSATSPVQVSYNAVISSSSAAIQVSLDGDSHVIDQNTFSGAINAGTTLSTCESPLLEVDSVSFSLTLTLLNPSESGPVSVNANISIYQTALEVDTTYNETYDGCCTRFFQFYINPENYGDSSNSNNAYKTTINLKSNTQIPFKTFSLYSENICTAGYGVFNRSIDDDTKDISWEVDDMSSGWWIIALEKSAEANYEITVEVEESYSDASCSAGGFCSAPDDESSDTSSPWYTWFSPVLNFFIVLAVIFSIIGFSEKQEEEQNFSEWDFDSVDFLSKKKKKQAVPEKKYQV